MTPLRVPRRPRRVSGVTIIELVIVLVVLGVVIALVAPSMRGTIARQRVQSVQADLLTDLQLARSELAQRSGTSTSVAVSFGGDAAVSCYTLHAVVPGVTCDCTRGAGNACTPAVTPSPEIKTAHVTRADGVSLAATSSGGSSMVFAPPQGVMTPADFVINVQNTLSGHLRTTFSALGVPSVCSPDGSMRGVLPCP
ncbi:MAG: prepilin-type N-terminal cleavage/methylation domain-containing protein [Burkholderiaceae bacterium]|nr:prepilin-type N-terminal cleavage/methylation domain-containing protein [Burkholderiaceae bacterium]